MCTGFKRCQSESVFTRTATPFMESLEQNKTKPNKTRGIKTSYWVDSVQTQRANSHRSQS